MFPREKDSFWIKIGISTKGPLTALLSWREGSRHRTEMRLTLGHSKTIDFMEKAVCKK